MNKSTFIVAGSLFVLTAAVNLQVPLYLTYAKSAGYGTGLMAMVFAGYVAGLLPVLIGLGGVSDRMGRKPVLLAGLTCATVATGAVIVMPNMVGLFMGRILQGIGVGLAVGTGTAYLAELVGGENGPTRAANMVALATSIGFGCGPLFTDIALVNRQALVPWSYWLLFALLLLSLATVRFVKSTPALGGNLVRLPVYPKGTVPMGFSIALAWAVTGIVITIVPGQLVHFGLARWAPVALFLVNGVGALVQPIARRFSDRKSMLLGFILIGIGTGVMTIASWTGMVVLLLLGAAIAGAACYGFTYLGGLANVSELGGERRAGAVAGYYLFAYLGYGLPSIGTGYLADEVGMLSSLLGFTAIVMVAAGILAYLVGLRRSVGESPAN